MKRGFVVVMIVGFTMKSSCYAHNLCYKAIEQTAKITGVSAALLINIAQVESGIGPSKQPWPWTINVQGRDYYFKSAKSAIAYGERLRQHGIHSFDVGCFQMNWRWHQHKVRSMAELIDPYTNALIAAQFLRELYNRHNSVYHAVAHYHSADKRRGKAYVQRVFKQ